MRIAVIIKEGFLSLVVSENQIFLLLLFTACKRINYTFEDIYILQLTTYLNFQILYYK